MRIFPSDFIHDDGFKNTESTGNYRIQLLIMIEGKKMYTVIKHPNNTIKCDNVSDTES